MPVTSNDGPPADRNQGPEPRLPGSGEPGADDVRRQLDRILDTRQFRRAPLLGCILTFLIETMLRGDVVRDATEIARSALGKGTDFASSKDPSVRVAMNRLRNALQIYYADEGARDDLLITLQPGSYRPNIAGRRNQNTGDPTSLALALSDAYQASLTRAKGIIAVHALQSALRPEPENPRLLAAYADLCIDSYKYGFDLLEYPLDEAIRAVERALSVTPDNLAALFEQGMLALAHDDMPLALEIGIRIKRIHGADPAATFQGSWLAAHTLDPVAAFNSTLGQTDQMSDVLGYYLEHPRFLAAYRSENYELALDAAVNFGLPDFYMGPMFRAAALAQLGLKDAAKRQLSRLLELNPSFSRDPCWHIGQHLKHADTREHLLEGLRKAGLGK